MGERVHSPIEKHLVVAVARFFFRKGNSIFRPMWGYEYGKADEDPQTFPKTFHQDSARVSDTLTGLSH